MNRQTTENTNGKNCWTQEQYYSYILQHFKAAHFCFSHSCSKAHRSFSAWRRQLSGWVGKFISYARYNIDDWLLSSFAAAAALRPCCFDKRMGIKLTKTVANENEKMLRKQQIAKALGEQQMRKSFNTILRHIILDKQKW